MQVGLIFLSSMADSIATIVAGAGGSPATTVSTALVAIAASTAIVGALTMLVGAQAPACCRPWPHAPSARGGRHPSVAVPTTRAVDLFVLPLPQRGEAHIAMNAGRLKLAPYVQQVPLPVVAGAADANHSPSTLCA